MFEISPARAAAAHTHLDDPSKDGAGSRDPHEGEHLLADVRLNIEFIDTGKCHLENDEDGGAENGCDRHKNRIQKGKEPDRKGCPSTIDRKDRDED